MDDKPNISTTRIILWIVGGVVGLYLVISGLTGSLSN